MGHSYYSCYEHLVFSTKHRVNYFTADFEPEVFAFLASTTRDLDCPSLIVGGHRNHVHLLVRKGKDILSKNLIKEIKRLSSVWMKERDPKLADFFWQEGYGAFSVSYSEIPKVTQYIRNQEKHHSRMKWEVEFRTLLVKNGVEFDERYYLD
jgi:REP element-mobilizing transposase RayT